MILGKFFIPLHPLNLIIPLNGLAQGRTKFSWRIAKEFFGSFENSEIIDADLDVNVEVEKSGRYIGIDCEITGNVIVPCDRCLEDLTIPIDTTVLQSVKFGEEPAESTQTQEGEREIVFIPQDNTELDLSQIVYDYVCISIPMQRVHEEGGCNPIAMKYLNGEQNEETHEEPVSSSPFAALKGLLENKN